MATPTYPIRDRWSFAWLFIGTMLGFLSYGAWLVPLVVWLSPVFTLRFMRTQPVWRGTTLTVLASYPMLVLLLRGVVPMPGAAYYIFVLIAAMMAVLPYLLDRLLAPRLPGFAATLVFPLAVTVLEFFNAQGEWGTWGAMAYTQVSNLPLVQLLSITGMWGLVLLIHWPATLINWAWEQHWDWRRVWPGIAAVAGMLTLVFGLGYGRLALAEAQPTVRVAGIPSDMDFIGSIGETHGELLDRVFSGAGSEAERDELRELFDTSNQRLLERSRVRGPGRSTDHLLGRRQCDRPQARRAETDRGRPDSGT
jgi:apolipoprotein N-acyltransferase